MKKHEKIIKIIENKIRYYEELTDKNHSFRDEINTLKKVLAEINTILTKKDLHEHRTN